MIYWQCTEVSFISMLHAMHGLAMQKLLIVRYGRFGIRFLPTVAKYHNLKLISDKPLSLRAWRAATYNKFHHNKA